MYTPIRLERQCVQQVCVYINCSYVNDSCVVHLSSHISFKMNQVFGGVLHSLYVCIRTVQSSSLTPAANAADFSSSSGCAFKMRYNSEKINGDSGLVCTKAIRPPYHDALKSHNKNEHQHDSEYVMHDLHIFSNTR